ncbi:MAG: tetratricopeptide repeat protein [Massilia sp.]
MEITRLTLPPITAPGDVTTFYSFEGGAARSSALSNMAVLLAGRQNGSVPVLMIDWDTESPGLHHSFGCGGERDGLLEYFEACRDQLKQLAQLGRGPAADDELLAREVHESIDWERYVERVDQSCPLYLMRAGRFDDSYGERADGMDWDALFGACPALFRCFGAHLARQFRHVLIDARHGRSAAVSVCTTLLPDKLVGVFGPSQRSLDGMAGVVLRAIEYRCSHEEEQRPLLVYPLPCAVDSGDAERRQLWRRGDPAKGQGGYQSALEKLLRQCYGMSQCSLESYLDEIQLQHSSVVGPATPTLAPRGAEHDGDRFSVTRTLGALLDWMVDGRFPWQSQTEVALLGRIDLARARLAVDAGSALSVPLATDLQRLGELYRAQGREQQAQDCFEESMELRRRLLGDDHADTRISRASLAALLCRGGKLHEARYQYDVLIDDCQRLLGAAHPDTLAARSGLAATMAQLKQYGPALALHEQIIVQCEEALGPGHAVTLDSLVGQAHTLTRCGELTRARMVYERVLEGRERLLGSEHEDTLRCTQQLALLLCEIGDIANARKLQEGVVRARERHAGHDHGDTLQAREALAEILAAQGDLHAVRSMQESLATARERRFGSEHPSTLSIQLRLASTLGEQGDLEAARRLQQHVVNLHERIHGMDDFETLRSKKMLAATLSNQGHSVDARKLEESVRLGNDRLHQLRGMPAGPHASDQGAIRPKAAILEARGSAAHPDTLGHKLSQLQQLIDSQSPREARELADSLRKTVLRPSVTHPLRKRGVAMIKQVYIQEGDKDALLAFTQDEVSWLEGALIEAHGGKPVAAQ